MPIFSKEIFDRTYAFIKSSYLEVYLRPHYAQMSELGP